MNEIDPMEILRQAQDGISTKSEEEKVNENIPEINHEEESQAAKELLDKGLEKVKAAVEKLVTAKDDLITASDKDLEKKLEAAKTAISEYDSEAGQAGLDLENLNNDYDLAQKNEFLNYKEDLSRLTKKTINTIEDIQQIRNSIPNEPYRVPRSAESLLYITEDDNIDELQGIIEKVQTTVNDNRPEISFKDEIAVTKKIAFEYFSNKGTESRAEFIELEDAIKAKEKLSEIEDV